MFKFSMMTILLNLSLELQASEICTKEKSTKVINDYFSKNFSSYENTVFKLTQTKDYSKEYFLINYMFEHENDFDCKVSEYRKFYVDKKNCQFYFYNKIKNEAFESEVFENCG